jgi:AhpD family alkylhydroperoxidase
MLGLETYLHQSGLELLLLNLINLRTSQINGCAYCIDMHWKDLRANGESEQRLYSLDAWCESPYYTDANVPLWPGPKPFARITDGHVSNQVYEEVRPHFNEGEFADLTLASQPSTRGTVWPSRRAYFPEPTSPLRCMR